MRAEVYVRVQILETASRRGKITGKWSGQKSRQDQEIRSCAMFQLREYGHIDKSISGFCIIKIKDVFTAARKDV